MTKHIKNKTEACAKVSPNLLHVSTLKFLAAEGIATSQRSQANCRMQCRKFVRQSFLMVEGHTLPRLATAVASAPCVKTTVRGLLPFCFGSMETCTSHTSFEDTSEAPPKHVLKCCSAFCGLLSPTCPTPEHDACLLSDPAGKAGEGVSFSQLPALSA